MSSTQTDPSFDASAHKIISLDEVFSRKENAITQLAGEFKSRGWAIVRLPKDPQSFTGYGRDMWGKMPYDKLTTAPETIKTLQAFFAQTPEEKGKCIGYSSVGHKEGIHLETPLWAVEKGLSESIKPVLKDWITLYDEITVDLIELLAMPVFGCKKSTLAHRADLPIAFGQHKGMLDIAHYFNQQTATLSPQVGQSTKDVNCVPHYDPGFLSISFLSTHDGLQLQDPSTGSWYAAPVNTTKGQEDLGIIWLGDAAVKASKGALRAGVHRVVYPQVAQPRIAVWYEMCTVDQLNQDRLDAMPKKGEVTLPNLPGSKPLTMDGDVRLIERYYGIPMSKVMRRSDSFSVWYSDDFQQDKTKYPKSMW